MRDVYKWSWAIFVFDVERREFYFVQFIAITFLAFAIAIFRAATQRISFCREIKMPL